MTEEMTIYEVAEENPPAPPIDCGVYLDRNELGDAELFSLLFADRFAYDNQSGDWYEYKLPYWERTTEGKLRHAIGNEVAARYIQAASQYRSQDNKEREHDYLVRSKALRSKRRVQNVLDWAAPLFEIPSSGWDGKPLVLTTENAIIDLATGKTCHAAPGDYLRAHAPVHWLGLDYPAPLWEKTVNEIFGGDAAMVAFIQRLMGYILTGLANERILPIFYGTGANGKSTMIEILSSVLGDDYSLPTKADALMENRNGSGERPSPLVMSLRGKRLVFASESKEGQRLDMGLVKSLTGGDTLSGRGMYEKYIVSFKPTHTVILITNHLPHVSADDQAAWDRVMAIEFSNRFVDSPQKANEYQKIRNLKERLKVESPGILAWMVRGCLAWQAEGLNPPQKVKDAGAEYRSDEDDFGLFLDELDTSDPNAITSAKDLYSHYQNWATDCRLPAMSLTAFGRRMKNRFSKDRDAVGRIVYRGVKF